MDSEGDYVRLRDLPAQLNIQDLSDGHTPMIGRDDVHSSLHAQPLGLGRDDVNSSLHAQPLGWARNPLLNPRFGRITIKLQLPGKSRLIFLILPHRYVIQGSREILK